MTNSIKHTLRASDNCHPFHRENIFLTVFNILFYILLFLGFSLIGIPNYTKDNHIKEQFRMTPNLSN